MLSVRHLTDNNYSVDASSVKLGFNIPLLTLQYQNVYNLCQYY